MRITKENQNINYEQTKKFFSNRAKKFNENNPYSVTMFQENHPEIVKGRNEVETTQVLEMLKICTGRGYRFLDLGCGIGRYAEVIDTETSTYCGIDFSEELISIAKQRNNKAGITFLTGSLINLDHILSENNQGLFNRVIIIGTLLYLNDNDIKSVLKQVADHCEEQSMICVRDSIAISDRLTLKDYYSEELQDDYNAIYRTVDEWNWLFQESLYSKGFAIQDQGFMFSNPNLNNRKETAQYFFILKR